MSGRVMVVRLLCRDVAAAPTSPLDLRGVFAPCVAFRVQGTPPKASNITEVQFALNAHTSQTSNTSGLTVTEYVAIGISSLLLGLVYVASVFLFLHIRKRRKATSDEGSRRLKGLKKKDGTAITERDIVRVNNERMQSIPNSMGQDDGIVKKNPLMNISRQFHETKSYSNDSGSNLSDSEDFVDGPNRDQDMYNNQTISAVIHQHHSGFKVKNDNSELSHRDESGIERLPDEHVSIVETTDDREIARPVGTTRRKLYFNPAYFEPNLMAEPPAAALEFLVKIREVISIAKHKMAAKRFQPNLNLIPEEETYPSIGNSLDLYHGLGSQRSGSAISLKRENSRKKNCIGCPGCKTEENNIQQITPYNIPACSNCINSKGDKQNSIRKWLEDIPTAKQPSSYSDLLSTSQINMADTLLSLPVMESRGKVRKQFSFSSSNSMYLGDKIPKKPTMSVRSDPVTRHYNLPLPNFENNTELHQNDFNYICQTVARVDDIRPIGLTDYGSGSLRNNASQRRTIAFPNNNVLPDMVNEAIALDHCTKSYNQSSSDEERFTNSLVKSRGIIQNFYMRNTSESLSGNDYETDSLERSSNKKGMSTPTDLPEVPSSQASPSLSAALPLEEELTMRNAVYKVPSSSNSTTPSPRQMAGDQKHYESVENKTPTPSTNQGKDYSLVSEVYVNNNYSFESAPTSPSSSECSMGSRKLTKSIKDSEEKPGCLTIEVKDSPENYIKIHESDGFEPDTLDRKHPKHKENIKDTLNKCEGLKTIDNIETAAPQQCIQLRSSGTFKKTNDKIEYTTKFNSLRNEYEHRNIFERPRLSSGTYSGSKSLEETTDDNWHEAEDWITEEGRILTLELRHSKRQRQSTPPTIKQIKNLARPDVLPPLPPTDDDPIYEQPTYPPRKVEIDKSSSSETYSKNASGRSLSPRTFTKNLTIESSSHNSISPELHGPSCSPMRASVPSQSSEYENMESATRKTGELGRNYVKRRSGRSSSINTETFVKGSKIEGKRFRRKKGNAVQDSGYLSSDSTGSRQVQRKLVIAKIVSCSESDDTENEARSESGAESVETHSVYFDNFRNQLGSENNYSFTSKSSKDSSGKFKQTDDCL